MLDGVSMATTMGFTAVDGLPMGTRTGSLDPGVLLYLMDERKMDALQIPRTALLEGDGRTALAELLLDRARRLADRDHGRRSRPRQPRGG